MTEFPVEFTIRYVETCLYEQTCQQCKAQILPGDNMQVEVRKESTDHHPTFLILHHNSKLCRIEMDLEEGND